MHCRPPKDSSHHHDANKEGDLQVISAVWFRRTMAWFWCKGGSFCTLIKQWKLSWYWWQIKMTYFCGEVSGIFIQTSVSTLLVYWREWTPCVVEHKNLNIPLSPREKRWIQIMDKSDSLIEETGLFGFCLSTTCHASVIVKCDGSLPDNETRAVD